MNIDLSPETEAWLDEKVRCGHFASYKDAIEYTVKLASLRETLLESVADPRRHDADKVRENLKLHFDSRRDKMRKI